MLFRHNNEEMSNNEDYYIKNLGLSENKFIPIQISDAVKTW